MIGAPQPNSEATADFAAARERMVDLQLRRRGISNPEIVEAFLRVPRHQFVAAEYRRQAYGDHPLPIGEGQTISQPYIVAVMLEFLQLTRNDKVLEIGTGSGYATALLAELSKEVFSIERHTVLANNARALLTSLGYSKVEVFNRDGSFGLAERAPYDAILVSAAAADIPPALISQLAEGARMILPVGSVDAQQLRLVRMVNGEPVISSHELVRFVPLISERN